MPIYPLFGTVIEYVYTERRYVSRVSSFERKKPSVEIIITATAEVNMISYFSVIYFIVKLVENDFREVAGRKTHTTSVDKNLELAELIRPALQRENPIKAKLKSIATRMNIILILSPRYAIIQ